MDIRQLRYFLAVADELSFTRAAERLNMAQPPLSRQIKALEQEIGAELFDRGHKQLALTRAGEALREEATAALSNYNAIPRRVRQAAEIARPSLTVGFVSAAGYSLLPRIARWFKERQPDTDLHLRCLTNREQAVALEAGEIEVGLAWLPFDRAGAKALPLMQDRFCVAMPNDHPLAGKRKIAVSMLRGHAIVFGCRTPSIGERIMRLLADAGPIHHVDDLRTAIDSAAAGLGLAIVPASVRPVKTDHVVFADLECDERLTIGAVSLGDAPSGAAADFLACASTLTAGNAGTMAAVA
jgi:LysR family transcriptional regulator, benzoate and cis,cis-muconate-responsive activator of ben and cat genes